jgi:ribulose-phosphate 3-epimerase
MFISLSILEYEQVLYDYLEGLTKSPVFNKILELIQTRKVSFLHVDVMRPPLIPNRITFPIKLIEKIYETLCHRIPLSVHLMVPDPLLIVDEISRFILKKDRPRNAIIIQRESFESENEALKAINTVREHGYDNIGICLDLPTPCDSISRKIIEAADFILLMTVHMGRGRQKYADKGTEKIAYFYQRYPDKPIWVDGGINIQTAHIAEKAGAKVVVVGSYITLSNDPRDTLLKLAQSLNAHEE